MNAQLMQKQETLPQMAGGVPIRYSGARETNPHLEGRSIILPSRFRKEEQLVSLMKGKQFLLLQKPRGVPRWLWFFGLDETHPFVTYLHVDCGGWPYWNELQNGGEEAFYKSLRPAGIQRIERREHRKAKRQGDWWFIRLSYSWKTIATAHRITEGERLAIKRVHRAQVAESNHCLTGKIAKPIRAIEGVEGQEVFLAEGLLEAPHHAPRKLKGPHLLVRRGRD